MDRGTWRATVPRVAKELDMTYTLANTLTLRLAIKEHFLSFLF